MPNLPVAAVGRILAMAALVSACASGHLVDHWKNPAFAGPASRNVLVVGLAPNDANRRLFEDQFAKRLRAMGIGAWAGHSVMPQAVPKAEEVRAAAERLKADGVMVTRVVTVEGRSEQNPQSMPASAGAFHGWYERSVIPQSTSFKVANLQTTFWDLKSGQAIWQGKSQVLESRDLQGASDELAAAIAGRMRRDGVL